MVFCLAIHMLMHEEVSVRPSWRNSFLSGLITGAGMN